MFVVGATLALPSRAHAHGLFDAHMLDRAPLLLTALLVAAAWLLYLLGGRKVAPRRHEALCFHAAMLLMVFSVFGPIDDWAETSTAWHMTQHMLFIIVIAPLWALARPLPQWRGITGRFAQPLWTGILRAGRYPTVLALLHGAVIWIWHTPKLYVLALDNLWWHAFEHACFLFTGWLFWWSVLRANPKQVPQALMAVLLTLMHTGLLGALLTFGSVSFYGDGRSVEDQQLAGLIMWVPGGLIYLIGGGWIAWRWLTRMWRRQQTGTAREELG
ncbi:cytochrome c oxidase assembly protein [Pseudomonas songnenensis]|uniref:Cytochrome c oxidase assembly protein n=1 Tax=Pseudomonas songnenensis TaxID=1176259 RepID=A0A482UAU2_9PSED|nr:cytochrome c oxidase assembly protein [Pseudomonas songnenensis]RYJ63661.1 cytochrome c oxidase assembly protein [Pseudomonas songnenensis]